MTPKRHNLKGILLLSLLTLGTSQTWATPPINPSSTPQSQAQDTQLSGQILDEEGEPAIGARVQVKGTKLITVTDIDGKFSLKGPAGSILVISYIGYQPMEVVGRSDMQIRLSADQQTLNEVVVTAMGIQRKAKSLTYATQLLRSDDLMKVTDPNVVNNIEGKVSGVVVTPSAGGAGGASKIIIRGNKSILGNSTPLIVVDGVPMTNNTRGQKGFGDGESLTYASSSEGSDPLSMINPDDIESMNILKGANAAALYGSQAANGVLMITTKRGKEGTIGVTYTANITFDTPLLTPQIQNIYGARVNSTGGLALDSWGDRVDSRGDSELLLNAPLNSSKFTDATQQVHLRNRSHNDLDDFFQTGVTVNNSLALSGGTEKIRTYVSFANSHANGMIEKNNYNRNTMAFRQSYNLWQRLRMEASLNYVQTVTRNRPGGGTILNPIYHLYITPRNLDMAYYRNNYVRQGTWISNPQSVYVKNGSSFTLENQTVNLSGDMQEWASMEGGQNNPYWLTRQNRSRQKTDRIYGSYTGSVDIWDGLSFQGRLRFDHTKFDGDSRRYATTFLPASMDDYGHYWKDIDKTSEIYTDYLLSYNKTFKETWDVSGTAGWVGHVIKTTGQKTDVVATYVDGMRQSLSNRINLFDTNSGGTGATTTSQSTNWDKAMLFTAQLGWKERIYVDASYRQDWYRAFKQFESRGMSASYGYFGVGANAILSELVKLPSWISYMKYRASFSEVGNSIPNIVFTKASINYQTGAVTPSIYSQFNNPKPEKTRSVETGIEASFLKGRLDFDFTFYNAVSSDQYMVGTNASGKAEPVNSGKIRNRGIETTIGYNFRFGKDWRWTPSLNFSFDDNEILETTYNSDGSEKLVYQDVAGVRVRYRKGGSIGDMYVNDYKRRADGTLDVTADGRLQFETEANKLYSVYVGNMNSKYQLGLSNTLHWKNLSLFFLINGRIGGKVISLTEAYLDNFGVSQRSADARLQAVANNLYVGGKPAMYLPDGSNRLVPVESYYKSLGGSKNPIDYIYDATNFRLRELSLSYMLNDLFGKGKNLQVSLIGRNLFFFYKDSPADPDVSLSTTNGLGAFELFNMPSARSFGLSLKVTL